jgi:ribosomal protein S12 methylthiotransferase accessory factor
MTEEVLKLAEKIINKKTGIASDLHRIKNYPDVPNLPFFIALTCKLDSFTDGWSTTSGLNGSGVSLDELKAKVKALCESMERYSQAIYKEENLLSAPYGKIKKMALDPRKITGFSKKQLKKLKNEKEMKFTFDEKTIFKWVKGFNLTLSKPIFIPAQLVYCNYKLKEEPVINIPLSTGASLGLSFEETICKGIYEVVERDAFMINYLNRLPREKIILEKIKNEEIQKHVKLFKEYELQLNVYEITTDVPIYSFICIIVDDKLGFFSTGLKSSLNPTDGIIGAIEESYQSMKAIRDNMDEKKKMMWKIKHPEYITEILDRVIFSIGNDQIKNMNFLLKNKRVKDGSKLKNLSSGNWKKDLKFLIKALSEKKMEVIYADVTTPDVKELGFYVFKVVIPGMHPLYLREKYKYLGGKRLYEVPYILGHRKRILNEEELNPMPHPFL